MNIAILGSTGSIGTQTLDVVRGHRELFTVELLTAHHNWQALAAQAVEFDASVVVITNEAHYDKLVSALSHTTTKVYSGAASVEQAVASSSVEVVVSAIVGFAGLAPTVAAVRAGKKVALANKESLVVGGELLVPLSVKCKAPLVPVDSEHSAIFQCLVGESSPLKRVIITASGGALRDMTAEQAKVATVEQVLRHPCWDMGAKITVNSATMLNKGFEVMEARWLFGLRAEQIEVVIHPESIIHSFVEFEDGALKAQLGTPDMRLPIQYALTFPYRMEVVGHEQWNPMEPLTFNQVDRLKYPCLGLAYEAMEQGGLMPTVLNAASEVAVGAFLEHRIGYGEIFGVIERAMEGFNNEKITTFERIIEVNAAIMGGIKL